MKRYKVSARVCAVPADVGMYLGTEGERLTLALLSLDVQLSRPPDEPQMRYSMVVDEVAEVTVLTFNELSIAEVAQASYALGVACFAEDINAEIAADEEDDNAGD